MTENNIKEEHTTPAPATVASPTPVPTIPVPAPTTPALATPTPANVAPETISFLTNMKIIYEHGFAHSKNKSRMHLLFAIHDCHYVVEQVLREKARDTTFNNALRNIGFAEIIKTISDRQTIPDYNHLLALNKIRNDVEHSNIIPDATTVNFYVRITEDFLKWSFKQYFDVNYEDLALENMIHDKGIRECLKTAKTMNRGKQ
jgi:hypothetical protein